MNDQMTELTIKTWVNLSGLNDLLSTIKSGGAIKI